MEFRKNIHYLGLFGIFLLLTGCGESALKGGLPASFAGLLPGSDSSNSEDSLHLTSGPCHVQYSIKVGKNGPLECGGGGGGSGPNPTPTPECANAPEGYRQIRTAQELSDIRNHLTENQFLCNDITLTGLFEPIKGLNDEGFTAMLDGNHKTISGLEIQKSSELDVGLFGTIGPSGTVKNLTLDSPNVFGYSNVGALAGNSFGGRVENITISGYGVVWGSYDRIGGLLGLQGYDYISGTSSSTKNVQITGGLSVIGIETVGGLIGELSDSSLENGEIAQESVVRGEQLLGGLVGRVYSSQIISSSSRAWVIGDKNAPQLFSLGGLVGAAVLSSSIEKSYAYGNIIGWNRADDVGGLVGSLHDSYLDATVASGSLDGSTNVGGLVGFSTLSTIRNSYSKNDYVYGETKVGGLVGYFHGLPFESDISFTYSTAHIYSVNYDNTIGSLVGVSVNANNGMILQPRHSYYLADFNYYNNGIGVGLELEDLSNYFTYWPIWNISYANNTAQTTWKHPFPNLTGSPRLFIEPSE